jgi:hypothetical protein
MKGYTALNKLLSVIKQFDLSYCLSKSLIESFLGCLQTRSQEVRRQCSAAAGQEKEG